jgi:hypothetical protein
LVYKSARDRAMALRPAQIVTGETKRIRGQPFSNQTVISESSHFLSILTWNLSDTMCLRRW